MNRETDMKFVHTPYDDVFRTLLNDCTALVIPVINEVFMEQYTGGERVIFSPNEHFLNRQDGKEAERITDTCFIIKGDKAKKYHLECQSTSDSSMLVRMFEYDTQIALDDGEIQGYVLRAAFPNSAVLFLRCDHSTPEQMQIRIETPGGNLSYSIPVMKAQRYTIEEIFEKKLLFLIPFNIFSHESRFAEYNKDEKKLEYLLREYEEIKGRLEHLVRRKAISEYTKCIITDMSNKVLESIARNYEHIREGVKSVMGGKVLDYEAKTIWNEGKMEGKIEGKIELLFDLVRKNLLTVKDAAQQVNLTEDEFLARMEHTDK